MKKFVCFVLVVLCVCAMVGCSRTAEITPPETYVKTNCKVYDVHRYGDEVAIIDESMDIWTLVDSDFGKAIGETCVLVMHNNGTPNDIYDDVIIEVQ